MKIIIFYLTVLFMQSFPVLAETDAEKGQRLIETALQKTAGFRWTTSKGQMILIDATGNRNERHFSARVFEQSPNDHWILLVFSFPADVAGTALLTQGKAGKGFYWLYLPKVKRALRIGGIQKNGAFLASEFSYEDLTLPTPEDYQFLWLADEPCPHLLTLSCYKIERRPISSNSAYSRIVDWLDQESFRTLQSEFYDRKDELLKKSSVSGFKLYNQHYWRPEYLKMANMRTGKTTELHWLEHDFDTPVDRAQFTTRAMETLAHEQ